MNESKGKILKSCLFLSLFSVFLLVWLGGCAPKKTPERTPQMAYEEALSLLERKKYERSAEAFRKFKEDFPLSTYTPLAELRLGDSLYFDKNYAESIVQYEDFKKLHPIHPEIPYAIYQIGMCHFKQMASIDRDQTVTERPWSSFAMWWKIFPRANTLPTPRTGCSSAGASLPTRSIPSAISTTGRGTTKPPKAALRRF